MLYISFKCLPNDPVDPSAQQHALNYRHTRDKKLYRLGVCRIAIPNFQNDNSFFKKKSNMFNTNVKTTFHVASEYRHNKIWTNFKIAKNVQIQGIYTSNAMQ